MITLIEVISYFFLYNFTLDGKVSYGNQTLLQIKRYLTNPHHASAQPRYYPQHTVGWINNPNYKIGGKTQNNKYGYRGYEFKLDKEENLIRIVCMGGSTTYGFGVDKIEDTYPYLLEQYLKNKYKDKKIEVINAGLDAASSIEELMNYQFKIKYFKPDIIIIKSGGNDAANQYDRGETYSPDMANVHRAYIHIPAVNPKIRFLFHSNFLSLINIFTNYMGLHNQMAAKHGIVSRNLLTETSLWFDKDLNFALDNMDYYNFYQNFNLLTDLFLRDSIDFYVMPFLLNPYVDNDSDYISLNKLNNQIMKDLTEKKGGIWMPIWEKDFTEQSWLGDDCHFNVNGNEVCAKLVANLMKF